MKKTGIATVTVMVVAIATVLALSCLLPALAQEDQPDLTITGISAHHNDYPSVWEDLDNTVDVEVKNQGNDDASTFKVKLLANDVEVDTEPVSGLATGDSTTVSFIWHPTDTGSYILKAVADSDGEINESDDEGNNEFELTEAVSVVHNGYMGEKPLTTYDHDTITGGIYYTIGDSFYSGKLYSGDTYTVTHDVTIPSGATVKFARLYSYWTWSPTYPSMELSFDDNTISPDAEYTDRKGWGYYDYPTGTYAYDVSSFVTESGSYTTVVENTGSDYFCMDGLGLLVVYIGASGSEIEYWINEGCDMLCTQTESEGLTPEEATATSVFEDTVDWGSIERAKLTTVVQSGGHLGTKLIFNDEDWTEVFDGTPYTDLDIDEECDVTDYLVSSDNTVKIEAPALEDDGGDYLAPSNAFLVLYYEEEEEPTAVRTLPAEPVSAGENFTIVIEASQHGYFAQIIETLPEGSVYVDSTLEQESVEVGDNTVKFELGDKHSFNYTVKVKAPESEGTYAFRGILIVEGNEYEVDGDNEIEVTPGPPKITAWNPLDAVVNNTEGESRTFNISVNQIVDISWQINGTEVQTNESITETAYTNISAVVGIWNVSVIATNTATGLSVLHTWIWNVTSEFTAGISDLNTEIEEGQGQEIITVENITTTPTPATEEKQKPGAEEEAPVPGFGLAISLFILIAVAYLIRVRKQGGVE